MISEALCLGISATNLDCSAMYITHHGENWLQFFGKEVMFS